VSGADGDRGFAESAAAKEFQQQDGLMVEVRVGARAGAGAAALELGDALGQFRPRGGSGLGGIENGGAQVIGDELEFIAGEAPQKAAGLRFKRTLRARGQRGNQDASQTGISCQSTNLLSFWDLTRIMTEGVPGCKGMSGKLSLTYDLSARING